MDAALAPGRDRGQRALSGSALQLDRLNRSYGGVLVVQDLSLEAPRGAFVALLGPSGCGKTTTLRMVAGLDRPDSGRVVVAGQDITALPPHRRKVGMVFQSYALFPHLTVQSNVAFGLRMAGVGRSDRNRRAMDMLGMVGLAAHAEKKPHQLSGGQQQRVALARALAIEPALLLLDEPLSALDAKLRQELRIEMRLLQRRVGATALFVTHDQAEALAMADLVAVMEAGRIVQLAPPVEVFERPATAYVAGFVGRSARLQGTLRSGVVEAGPLKLRVACLPPGLGDGSPVQVFVRPHRIRLLAAAERADNVIEGTVLALDYTGETVQVVVDTRAGQVPMDLPTEDGTWHAVRPADAVRLGWRADDSLCFPQ